MVVAMMGMVYAVAKVPSVLMLVVYAIPIISFCLLLGILYTLITAYRE